MYYRIYKNKRQMLGATVAKDYYKPMYKRSLHSPYASWHIYKRNGKDAMFDTYEQALSFLIDRCNGNAALLDAQLVRG